MTKINILSPLVADMIAAGEVVERPASVIKELLENAFDAGAKKVCVEYKNGGATYIRVTDDGCGMSPEDAGIAFTRHATSKLHDAEGLSAIGTMGFRGEALAAISAVSRIELTTREKGAAEGTRISVQAGDILDMSACGCPEGTTIVIRDIFFNTPARLKFLRSDRSEAGACLGTALRCALGRPEVSVRCIRDGEEAFFTPGDARTESAVYSLLGRDAASAMLPVASDGDGISVEGFVSSPAKCRGNRSMQFFFCNGRYIKSPLLQSAVEQAYKNTLLTGRFPACVIYLSVRTSSVDVNVHPAKTEIRFSEEKKVFDLIYSTVRAALEAESRPLEISLSEGTRKAVSPSPESPAKRDDFYKTETAESFRQRALRAHTSYSVSPSQNRSSAPAPAPFKPAPGSVAARPAPASVSARPTPSASPAKPSALDISPVAQESYRVIGEALSTYVMVEMGEELLLIDKHAAHERMIFDRLKKTEREIMSQSLLIPEIIKPSAEDAEIIAGNTELFRSLGFELEPYGQSSLALRSIPDGVDIADAASTVEELCLKIKSGKTPDPKDSRDELLHTVACKAAIKAGKRHSFSELEKIAEAVIKGGVKYCPHGRPVSVKLTKKELDKFFSRIV